MNESKWQILRSVTQADVALDAAKYDGKPSYARGVTNVNFNNIEIIVAGIGAENGTVEINLWGGRNIESGPAQLIATITFTLGTMQVNKDPATQEATELQLYADSASIVSYWPTEIKNPNSGNNLLCSVSFDMLDMSWLAAEIKNMTDVSRVDVFCGAIE
jgi:hypothetical protein